MRRGLLTTGLSAETSFLAVPSSFELSPFSLSRLPVHKSKTASSYCIRAQRAALIRGPSSSSGPEKDDTGRPHLWQEYAYGHRASGSNHSTSSPLNGHGIELQELSYTYQPSHSAPRSILTDSDEKCEHDSSGLTAPTPAHRDRHRSFRGQPGRSSDEEDLLPHSQFGPEHTRRSDRLDHPPHSSTLAAQVETQGSERPRRLVSPFARSKTLPVRPQLCWVGGPSFASLVVDFPF